MVPFPSSCLYYDDNDDIEHDNFIDKEMMFSHHHQTFNNFIDNIELYRVKTIVMTR